MEFSDVRESSSLLEKDVLNKRYKLEKKEKSKKTEKSKKPKTDAWKERLHDDDTLKGTYSLFFDTACDKQKEKLEDITTLDLEFVPSQKQLNRVPNVQSVIIKNIKDYTSAVSLGKLLE